MTFNSTTNSSKVRTILALTIISALLLSFTAGKDVGASKQNEVNVSATQLQHTDLPFNNSSWSGNPFDLIATATFDHNQSDATFSTELFYAGDDQWIARFTPEQPGTWNYSTSSSDSDLNGKTGTVTVSSSNSLGFVQADGQHWVRSKTGQAFVPQFVMGDNPSSFYNNPSKIDSDVAKFIGEHGFNGIHVKVECRWFDVNTPQCTYINSSNPNPDMRTFEALEQLIEEAYMAGGIVHIWVWGDAERVQTPARWGYNGSVDRRLQRYIAARLGPMPGWTMGYGFDLFEWTTESQLDSWHSYMHDHMASPHLLGARSNKNEIMQISEVMDYSGYEQHRPDYNKYVESLNDRSHKPTFSEDRFRVRDEGREKDYSLDDTRQGLWRSGMAGGVANIWGYLQNGGSDTLGSAEYPNKSQIKLYSTFFGPRFHKSLSRCNDLTDGVCLKSPTNKQFLFYRENSSSIRLNLSQMGSVQAYVAVNTKTGETRSGTFNPNDQVWNAPTQSDWAIAVGNFCDLNASLPSSECSPPPTMTPTPTQTATQTPIPTNTPTATATATATAIPPTATPTAVPPTFTPMPTQTSTPVVVPTKDDISGGLLHIFLPVSPR